MTARRRNRALRLLALLVLTVGLPVLGGEPGWLAHGAHTPPPDAGPPGAAADLPPRSGDGSPVSFVSSAGRPTGPGSAALADPIRASSLGAAPAPIGEPEPVAPGAARRSIARPPRTRAGDAWRGPAHETGTAVAAAAEGPSHRRATPSSRLRRVSRDGVRPGGVATVLVEIPVAAGDRVAYRVTTVHGVRLFSVAEGRLAGDEGGRSRLPLTFTLPPHAPAGDYEAGRVEVRGADGRSRSYAVVARVLAVPQLHFRLAEASFTVPAGSVGEIGFSVTNAGNVTDTLRLEATLPGGWERAGDLPPRALEPGETAEGVLRVAAPAGVGDGDAAGVVVAYGVAGTRSVHPVRLVTVPEEGPVTGFAHLPASVFVGSTSEARTHPAVALTATGELLPGTRMRLEVRSYDRLSQPAAFRESLAGPRLHLGLERAGWSLRLGDLYSPPDLLTGAMVGSRGVTAGWRGRGTGLEVTAATPTAYGVEPQEGQLLRARGRLATSAGELSLELAHLEHTPTFGSAYTLRAMGAGYRLERPGHRLTVQAGVLSVGDTAATRTGPMLDARYQLTGRGTRLGLRVRRVPGTVQQTAGYGDEAFLTASHDLTAAVTVSGWGFERSSEQLDGPASSSRGGGAGFRFRLPGRSQLQLLGTYRENEREGRPMPSVTRTLRAGLNLPLGPVTAEFDADLGTTDEAGGARPFRSARGGVRWNRGSDWAWAGASYHDLGYGTPYTTLDASGSLRFREARFFGGATARLTGLPAARAVTLWSGSSIPLASATDLAVGLDYQPYAIEPFRLSVGISHRLRLPLPIPRPHALEGVVFEDRNGNRTLDADEAVLPDVGIVYGPFRARTDDGGRFAFRDAAGSGPSLDPATLPPELVLPPDVFIPGQGRVEIPLIRLASLRLELFLDRDGDRTRDPVEAGAERARATLRDARGREREAVADLNGVVRFGALEAGRYTLSLQPAGERPAPPVELEVRVDAGTEQTLEIALPAHRREIRTPDGGPLRLFQGSDQAGPGQSTPSSV